MSEKESSSGRQPGKVLPPDLEARSQVREQVFGSLLGKLKPWLFEFGNWMFGGLLAFNLVIAVPLLSLGPDHPAILVAMAAFACALPLNVSGLFSLKLIKDMKDVAFDEVMRQAFEEANVPDVQARFPATEKDTELYKKRTDVALRFGVRVAGLSVALTLVGMLAALYYMAWWVAALFAIMVVICLALTMNVVARLMRPDYDREKAKAARAQSTPN